MKIFVQDRVSFKTPQTAREYSAEGFLKVPGRVAKTGVQTYTRRELGLDGNPGDTVVVYRPESEVFSEDSLASYDGIDLTILHPKELVNTKNYKETSVGVVRGKGRRDGDFVVVDMIFKDAEAIARVEQDGYVELSGGYTAEYVAMDGIAPCGTAYQYEQHGILMNHVASLPVNSARAGRKARLFDQLHQPEGIKMKTVTLDSGRTVEIQDEAVALLVTDAIERLKESLKVTQATADEAKADSERKQAKIDAMEEENEKKKGETSDSVIASRIAEITAVTDKAKEIESAYVADSIDPVAIMRGVLTTARPTVDWAAKSDEYVSAAFDMAHENAKAGVSGKSAAQQRQIAADAANGIQQPTGDAKPTAYSAYKDRMTNTQAESK